MGKYQRDKGMRFEREFAKMVKGYRVPLSGAMGGEYTGDVKAMGMTFECKVRKDGFKKIYEWLQNADALAIKADRKDPLIVIPVERFLHSIAEPTDRERELQDRVAELELALNDYYDPFGYGDRLQNIRLIRGKTVAQVANKACVSVDVVNDWESNASRPTLEEVIRVAKFLNTSTRYLELGLIETGDNRVIREREPA